MTSKPLPDPSDSIYRCAACGNGDHLHAYANATASGPLHADGTLAQHDYVDENYTHVDSIACDVHGDTAEIHWLRDGAYHRWAACEACNGTSYRKDRFRHDLPCYTCQGSGGEWALVEEAVPVA